jgi:hypothetical protein
MKRYLQGTLLIMVGVLIGLIAQLGIRSALAQTAAPIFAHWGNSDRPMGRGMGIMDHDAMQATMAEAFGLTVDEFAAALAEGQKPRQLAAELGLDWAEIQVAMQAAHAEALAQAVAEGLITQEQANQMLVHHAQMGNHQQMGAHMGNGAMGRHMMGGNMMGGNMMGRGMMGAGPLHEDCPFAPAAAE